MNQKQLDDLSQKFEDTLNRKLKDLVRILGNNKGKEPATEKHTPVHQQASRNRSDAGILMSSPSYRQAEAQASHHSRNSKFEFSKFNGKNPRKWLRKYNKYFLFNPMPDYEKILCAAMHMEDLADSWYLDYIEGRENIGWERFSDLILERFSAEREGGIVGQFNKLKQDKSVEEYVLKFEELKTFMLSQNRHFHRTILFKVLLVVLRLRLVKW